MTKDDEEFECMKALERSGVPSHAIFAECDYCNEQMP